MRVWDWRELGRSLVCTCTCAATASMCCNCGGEEGITANCLGSCNTCPKHTQYPVIAAACVVDCIRGASRTCVALGMSMLHVERCNKFPDTIHLPGKARSLQGLTTPCSSLTGTRPSSPSSLYFFTC
ncbi:hypothetical protein GGI42DRAFT_310466 [Trichoderma sp. SZMC 28013]